MDRERTIERYLSAWLRKDASCLPEIFSEDVIYSECYGPEYDGLPQVLRWFEDWNRRGTVLRWEIKQMISQQNVVVAEWYFACEYDEEKSGFDGVSLVTFDGNGKIASLKEFQSKAEHTYPYGDYEDSTWG